MADILISSRIFIPKKDIDTAALTSYEIPLYQEATCGRCPVYKSGERHSSDCDPCAAFLGVRQLWREKSFKGVDYVGLPPGRPDRVQRLLQIDLSKAIDLRPEIPFTHQLKFTGDLYHGQTIGDQQTVDQVAVVAKWLRARGGIIEVPPRGGKCIVGSSLVHTNRGLLPIRNLFDKNHRDGYSKPVYDLQVLTDQGYQTVTHLYKKRIPYSHKITSALGHTVRGTPIHPVKVLSENLALEWKPLADIQAGEYICVARQSGWNNQNKIRKDLAEITGFMVANGCMNVKNRRASFTSDNTIVQAAFVKAWYSYFGRKPRFIKYGSKAATAVINYSEMHRLIALGLPATTARYKIIPSYILQADTTGLLDYLSAYLSCDSSATTTKLELCTASKRMARQLHVILAELDVHGKLEQYTSYARNGKKILRKYYSIDINGSSRTRLIDLIHWYKPVSRHTDYNDDKYLLTAVPYVRQLLTKFVQNYSTGNGWFEYRGRKIQRKIPFVGTADKNLVSRANLLQQKWPSLLRFISAFDSELANRLRQLIDSNYVFVEVIKAERIDQPITVYDLSVPATRSFIANGVVVHNTVMAAYIACELGLKTIIVAHERHLLRQFRRTFRGDRKHPAFTNAKKLEQKLGKPVVKIIDKMSDFTDDVDVALVNYQKFIRNPESIARIGQYINNHFSLLLVDECHMPGALRYAQFISRLNCRYRGGLTATPDRKDGMSVVVKEFLGSTVARSTTTAMIPEIELIETSIKPKYDYRSWVYAMKFLATNSKRRELIIREIFKDLRAGHTIIIPVDFVKPGQDLVDAINKQAEYNNDNKSEQWPAETAVLYSNQIRNPEDLKSILARVDRGRHRVLVAIRSKIKMGIDLDSPTRIYCVVPMSATTLKNERGEAVGAPMFYQLSHRVSTWAKGKAQPVVKLFVDVMPHSVGCFKSLFWKEIVPGLRSDHRRAAKYKMQPEEFKRAVQIAQGKEEYLPPGKPGQRIYSKDILAQQSGKVVTAQKSRSGFLGLQRAA